VDCGGGGGGAAANREASPFPVDACDFVDKDVGGGSENKEASP
jgi:hypothetical protein